MKNSKRTGGMLISATLADEGVKTRHGHTHFRITNKVEILKSNCLLGKEVQTRLSVKVEKMITRARHIINRKTVFTCARVSPTRPLCVL